MTSQPSKAKIIVSIFLISLVVLVPELIFGGGAGITGNDTLFHLTRYVDAAAQLQSGHLTYFQQFFSQGASGRILNAFYGPYFAYLQGAILLATGFNGLLWYALYCLTLNITACASMYYLQRSLGVDFRPSLIISGLFIVTGNVTAQVASGAYAFGFAFFPLIVAAALRLLRDKDQPVKAWELTLAVTALTQTHLLSLALGALLYALAFIVFAIRRTRQLPSALLQALKALLWILLLNFNVWGAALEVLGSNNVIRPVSPAQLTLPATLAFTSQSFTAANGFTAFSGLIALLLILALARALFVHKPLHVHFALWGSLTFALAAFGLPLIERVPGALLLQFYTRFMIVTYTLALVVLGYVLSHLRRSYLRELSFAVLLASATVYAIGTSQSAQDFANQKTSTQSAAVKSPRRLLSAQTYSHLSSATLPTAPLDYLPNPTGKPIWDFGNAQNEETYSRYQTDFVNTVYRATAFKGSHLRQSITPGGLQLSWDSPVTEQTVLPVVSYAHTQLTLNNQLLTASQRQLTDIGAVSVTARAGHNRLLVGYQPATWFIFGMIIHLLAVLVAVFYGLSGIARRRLSHAQHEATWLDRLDARVFKDEDSDQDEDTKARDKEAAEAEKAKDKAAVEAAKTARQAEKAQEKSDAKVARLAEKTRKKAAAESARAAKKEERDKLKADAEAAIAHQEALDEASRRSEQLSAQASEQASASEQLSMQTSASEQALQESQNQLSASLASSETQDQLSANLASSESQDQLSASLATSQSLSLSDSAQTSLTAASDSAIDEDNDDLGTWFDLNARIKNEIDSLSNSLSQSESERLASEAADKENEDDDDL